MSHRRNHSRTDSQPAAIFSPSVARAAQNAAKDWNYIDNWLARKFSHASSSQVPDFERNPDTLRALLALAAANEQADEERALLARVEAAALREAEEREREAEIESEAADDDESDDAGRGGERGRESDDTPCKPSPYAGVLANNRSTAATTRTTTSIAITAESAKAAILDAVENALPREGRAALDALAGAATELGVGPSPADVGRRLVALQAQTHEVEQAAARVAALQRHITAETRRVQEQLAVLTTAVTGDGGEDEDEHHHHHRHVHGKESSKKSVLSSAADLAKQNLETQRRVKALAAALPDLRDKVAAAAAGGTAGAAIPPSPSIEEVRREEERYLALLAEKRELDARVRAFQGLPPDADQARRELDRVRSELRRITQRRDAFFEGLVERATPRKPAYGR